LTIKNPGASGDQNILTVQQNGAGTSTLAKVVYNQTDDSMKIINASTFAGSYMGFWTSNTEKARIDSGGSLFLGTTSFSAFPTQTTGNMAVFQMGITYGRSPQNASGRYWFYGSEGSAGATYIIYNNNNTGVYLAYGGTAWTANSDERMKTTLVPFEDAVGKVCSLRAGTGRYLTDEEDVSRSFLIAQDVQAVLPEAVDIKEDEQGTLGLRYTDVVPLLVAAIKEQQALITDLTARIAILEAK
jgi:hypothetical protein